jgi:hypothetical protein
MASPFSQHWSVFASPERAKVSQLEQVSKTGQETKGARGRTGGVDKRASH